MCTAIGEDEEMFEAIEEELPLIDADANILSETAADSGQKQVRRLHLERQRSTQYDPELMSPQGVQPMSPHGAQPFLRQRSQPTTPLDRQASIKKQLSKQKSINDPVVRQLSKQKSINEPPEKMDKGAAKDENTRLIQAETAETGHVSQRH